MRFCGIRTPATRNEMRQYYKTIWNEEGIEIRVRPKRRPKHLPTSWLDIEHCCQRSWKLFRLRQWKQG